MLRVLLLPATDRPQYGQGEVERGYISRAAFDKLIHSVLRCGPVSAVMPVRPLLQREAQRDGLVRVVASASPFIWRDVWLLLRALR